MRLLSRSLFTILLLGGLAFGSYAFGKYVLSSRLFGVKGANLKQNFGERVSEVKPAAGSKSAARPQTASSGDGASASVELLPAEGTSSTSESPRSAPQPTPSSSIIPDRPSNEGAVSGTRETIGGSTYPDSTSSDSNSNSDSPRTTRRRRRPSVERAAETSPTPRPRRKRRRRPRVATPRSTSRNDSARSDNSSDDNSGIVVRDSSPDEVTIDEAPATRIEPRRETSPDSSGEGEGRRRRRRPRRIRERVEEAPRERVRSRERNRDAPARRTDESPVPVPESGGDSPVPIPE